MNKQYDFRQDLPHFVKYIGTKNRSSTLNHVETFNYTPNASVDYQHKTHTFKVENLNENTERFKTWAQTAFTTDAIITLKQQQTDLEQFTG